MASVIAVLLYVIHSTLFQIPKLFIEFVWWILLIISLIFITNLRKNFGVDVQVLRSFVFASAIFCLAYLLHFK